MENKKVIEALQKQFPEEIKLVSSQFNDDIVHIDKKALLEVMSFLKETPYDFKMLLDLTCVDYLGEEPRFEMVYHVFSVPQNLRLRIKTRVPESDLEIDSVTDLWKNANWLEREIFDMFGIRFFGHPDLRRLFMYDGFEGYPLRKDYPLRKQQPRIAMRNDNDD